MTEYGPVRVDILNMPEFKQIVLDIAEDRLLNRISWSNYGVDESRINSLFIRSMFLAASRVSPVRLCFASLNVTNEVEATVYDLTPPSHRMDFGEIPNIKYVLPTPHVNREWATFTRDWLTMAGLETTLIHSGFMKESQRSKLVEDITLDNVMVDNVRLTLNRDFYKYTKDN